MNAFAEKILNGQWLTALDPDNTGRRHAWYNAVPPQAAKAVFPGLVQDNFPEFCWGVAWYWHSFSLDAVPENADCFLKVGAAEFIVEYWLNGTYIGRRNSRQSFFELCCTEAVGAGENLLAIRVAVPGRREQIDGYFFSDTSFWLDNLDSNSAGGIFQPLKLAFRPKIRTDRAVVRADLPTGRVSVDVQLHNGTAKARALTLSARILTRSGENTADHAVPVLLEPKGCTRSVELQVPMPNPWTMDEPYLYTLQLTLAEGETVLHQYGVRFGFREFLVKDGWFFLNGKRIFLSTIYNREGFHPRGGLLNNAILYKELVHVKSMNFDSIRFHNYVPAPEILDMCDELGLLVIQAHGASWGMKEDSRYLEEQFRDHLQNTVENCINHPSVVAWELQNECHGPREGRVARDALPFLRALDPTRLIFFSSGRWDPWCINLGSVSNPGSMEWECVWGIEDAATPDGAAAFYEGFGVWDEEDNLLGGPQRGDVHLYPSVPLSVRGRQALRECGKGTKPCFLSECGSGAMGEMYESLRRMEQLGFVPNSRRTRSCVECADYFSAQWEKFGLGDLYPFENDLLLAGDRLNAKTRTEMMDCIRSNPQLAGVCVSCLSGPYSGFGLLDWFGERKAYIPEAVAACLAPVRWCIFVDPAHTYRNTPFTVEAVLASEDVLEPGEYPVRARIVSAQTGCVWEHKTVLRVERGKDGYLPLSFPVFRETLCLDVPPGDYALSISLDQGAVATGGRKTIHIAGRPAGVGKTAALLGVDDAVRQWLVQQGVEIRDDAGTVLVGDMPETDTVWEELYGKVSAGATAVFLKPEAFLNHIESPRSIQKGMVPHRLQLAQKGTLRYTSNWAWRTHTIMKKHPYAEGLPIGLLPDDIYNEIIPRFIFEEIQMPDEVAAVTLGAPFADGSSYEYNNRFSGVAIGVYCFGKGKLVLNTFEIFKGLGKNPAADRLLLNFLG